MKYAIQINSTSCQSAASHTAHQFIKAALLRGHDIIRVFFYHDGIHEASRGGQESTQPLPWRALAEAHGIDLVLCISAAQRRGLVDPTLDLPVDGITPGIAEGFRVAGLALWVDACLQADRVLVFG